MSRCDVSIEFDRPDRKYRGGESVAGFVHVVAHQAMTYDSITLACFWRCHGYGLPVTKPVHGALIDDKANLSAGERRSFPFSFEAPPEPLTYHGEDLNIDQYVCVEVDVPTGKIQEYTEQYQLVPGVAPGSLNREGNEPGRVASDTGPKQGWAFSLVLLFIAAASFLVAPIFGYFFLGILVLSWVHALLLKGQLRSFVVTTPNTVVGVGGDYALTVSCTPRMSLSLRGIRVKLRCLEQSKDYPDHEEGVAVTNPTTISQEVYQNEKMYSEGVVLKAGQRFTTEIRGTIPQTEAYSFATGHGDVWEERVCAVRWELQVSVSTRLFAGWTGSIPLQVVPSGFLEDANTEG